MSHSRISTIFTFVFTASVIFMMVCLIEIGSANTNKYFKETNEMHDGDRRFKMNKVNALWKKASEKISSDEEKADLLADLKIQDAYEIKVKEGYSKERAAMASESYQSLIKKWLPQGDMEDDMNKVKFTDDDKEMVRDLRFDHPKLQILWKQVLDKTISDENLLMLKEKFEHQEMNIKEFQQIKRDILGMDESDLDPSDTDVDTKELDSDLSDDDDDDHGDDDHGDDDDAKIHDEMLFDLKIKIKNGFQQLRDVIASTDDTWFSDPRASRLWQRAQRTAWSPGRLAAFQNELHEFDRKVIKHRNYKKELESLKHHIKEDSKGAKDRHDWLLERAGYMKKKVFKLLDDLQMQVDQGFKHYEL